MIVALKTVLKENLSNVYRIYRLALYEFMLQNADTTLGIIWSVLNPMIRIFVYWFVFAVGLRSSAPQGGYPYLIWMITGLVPWFFISEGLTIAMVSIINYRAIITKMPFPISIIPTKTIVSSLISHIFTMAVMLAYIFLMGYHLSPLFYQCLYYIGATFFFLLAYALLASAINVVFRDFQKIMNSVIRLLFFISPTLWVQDKLPATIRLILSYSPITYLIEGYRDTLLYSISIFDRISQGAVFWIFTLSLFVVGASVHHRFRNQFIDII